MVNIYAFVHRRWSEVTHHCSCSAQNLTLKGKPSEIAIITIIVRMLISLFYKQAHQSYTHLCHFLTFKRLTFGTHPQRQNTSKILQKRPRAVLILSGWVETDYQETHWLTKITWYGFGNVGGFLVTGRVTFFVVVTWRMKVISVSWPVLQLISPEGSFDGRAGSSPVQVGEVLSKVTSVRGTMCFGWWCGLYFVVALSSVLGAVWCIVLYANVWTVWQNK